MGDLTLEQMRDAARYALSEKRDLTSTQLDRWLNWSYFHVAMPSVHRHQENRATHTYQLSEDVVEYDLSSSTLGKQNIGIFDLTYFADTNTNVDTRRRRLEGPVNVRRLDERSFPAGEPTRYARYGNTLILDNRPTSAMANHRLRLRYWHQPVKLVSGSDTTIFPALWDEVIVLGARWRGWRELNQPDRAEIAKRDFSEMVNEIQETVRVDSEDWGGTFEPELEDHMEMA